MYSKTKIYIVDRSSGKSPVLFGKQEFIYAVNAAGASVENVTFWSDVEKDTLCIVMGESTGRLIEKLLEETGVKL